MDDAAATTFFEKFTSPWRNLAWSFRKSREAWKEKYQELKREHKRLQNQVHDVRLSREQWRKKAEQEGASSAALRAEIVRLEAELATASVGEKKRNSEWRLAGAGGRDGGERGGVADAGMRPAL